MHDVTGPRDPKLKKRGKNCVNADAVKEPATPSNEIKREHVAKIKQLDHLVRACL